ncbi:MAG: MFS transporter [Thermoplasmata archaeon]|nr:MAG: MFS transporter [Thermoplasmata archaeon]
MDSKRKFLSLVSYNHAITHGVVLSIPIAANYIQVELDLSYTLVFLPLSISIFMYGVGAVLAGYLIDRKGAVKPMLAGITITTVCMAMLMLSDSWQWFSIWIVAAGFGLSFAHPSGLTLVSQLFPKKRGRAMGTFGFIGQFGQFIPPIAAAAIGKFFFWNYIFLVFFVLYLIALFLCAQLLRTEIKGEDVEKPKSIQYTKALGALFTGIVLMVLLLTALRGNYYRAITSVLTYYSNDVLELDILTGAIFLSIMLITGLPGHLIGGWLADKHGPIKPLVIFSVLAVLGITLCLSLNLWILLIGLCIVGFSFFSAQPAENVLTANVSTLNVRGTLYGLKFLVSFGFSFVGLILIGVFGDIYSLIVAFYIILVFAVATLFTVFLIVMLYKGPKEPEITKNEKWDFE